MIAWMQRFLLTRWLWVMARRHTTGEVRMFLRWRLILSGWEECPWEE